MKTLKLILIGALLTCTAAVQAQDTTKVSGTQDKTGAATNDRSGPGVGAQDQTQSNTPDENYRKDMSVIPSSEVPPTLRSNLKGDQYKGWEQNSTIYKGRNNDSFIVEMREGTQTKVHRFDKDGNPVQD
jgi:hypothetical protein